MPKKANFSDDLLRLAATLYYVDRLPQTEVAKLVRVSQTKVSRLLSIAQERGIVRISVEQYDARNSRLEHELCSRFGLQSAAVIRSPMASDEVITRQNVGHFGAPFVAELIPTSGVIALGGGRSVSEVVQKFHRGGPRRLTVVQAMGSIDSSVSSVDALELGRTMVKQWGGEFLTLSTPAFANDKAARDFYLASPQVEFVWQRLITADAALVGVGALDRSVYEERGVLTKNDITRLKKAGAVGEICGRFISASGKECVTRWRERVVSIDLEHLRKIPQVIGVAAGAGRAEAVAASLRGRLINSLLIDEVGATALLELVP